MVRLPRNEKQTYRLNSKATNKTIRLDLDHNLDLWIFKVKRKLDLWPHTWPWPWIFMVKFWNSCISEWEGRLTLHKEGGSRSYMTVTMTIWWPRSGIWIYQIVTGVTSVVGVPSTHLVQWDIDLIYIKRHTWFPWSTSHAITALRVVNLNQTLVIIDHGRSYLHDHINMHGKLLVWI